MATNNGESKIKQDLQANLKIDDAGSIAEMLAKVKQLTTQVNTLSKAMEKVMGRSPSKLLRLLFQQAALQRLEGFARLLLEGVFDVGVGHRGALSRQGLDQPRAGQGVD